MARIMARGALVLLDLHVFAIDVFATDIAPIDGSGIGRRRTGDGTDSL